MRTSLLAAALLAIGAWAAAPAAAQQAPLQQQEAPSMGSPAAGTAAQGGEQGGCPAGQVRNPNGECLPGQPDVSGTTTGAEGGAEMPASPHQQELLQGVNRRRVYTPIGELTPWTTRRQVGPFWMPTYTVPFPTRFHTGTSRPVRPCSQEGYPPAGA